VLVIVCGLEGHAAIGGYILDRFEAGAIGAFVTYLGYMVEQF
jgi:hypothetical protein